MSNKAYNGAVNEMHENEAGMPADLTAKGQQSGASETTAAGTEQPTADSGAHQAQSQGAEQMPADLTAKGH